MTHRIRSAVLEHAARAEQANHGDRDREDLRVGAAEPLLHDSELAQDEGVTESAFVERVVAAGRAAVPGGHIGLEQHRIAARRGRAQLRGELRAFPIRHLAVVERHLQENRRIGLRPNVVERRIRPNVVVRRLLGRVGPGNFTPSLSQNRT
jgi:hypothetical protein